MTALQLDNDLRINELQAPKKIQAILTPEDHMPMPR